jgi:hypothetical protein
MGGLDSIHLAQNKDKYYGFVNTVISTDVPSTATCGVLTPDASILKESQVRTKPLVEEY